jgi:F-type H+-transporting ATPase subunit b
MKFDIWTFLFQIINFAVLLFILKRLLYKPIREIMEKRRGLVEKTIEDAEKAKKEALEIKEKHLKEMNDIGELKIQMLEKMKEETEIERKNLMTEAEKEAGKIIEKEKAIFYTEKRRLETELKDEAVETVSVFAANLLKDLSDEELHKGIYRKLLNELGRIASEIMKIKGKGETLTIDLFTAYPLNEEELKKIQNTFESHIPQKITVNTTVDSSLIAGIRIKAYDMIYDSSLSGQIDILKLRLKETA